MRTEKKYSVAKWARFFEVSRSGYYAYAERRERRDEEKKAKQKEIKRIFSDSDGTYGPDRICGILRRCGKKASYRKISDYMADMGFSRYTGGIRAVALQTAGKRVGKDIQTS